MIEKKKILDINDGGGLYDAPGLLRSAISDLNGLTLAGVNNWEKMMSALQKIAAVIKGLDEEKAQAEEAQDRRAEQEAQDAAKEVKLYEFGKGGETDGDV